VQRGSAYGHGTPVHTGTGWVVHGGTVAISGVDVGVVQEKARDNIRSGCTGMREEDQPQLHTKQ
jgi:hypothetical protein